VIFTVFKLIHLENTLASIVVTPDGIDMDVNDEHSENAKDPIDLTEDGIIIDARFLQLQKAYGPIEVRFYAIKFTVFKLVHP